VLDQQTRFEVRYESHLVGEYIPDLLISGKVIVETKVIEKIGLPQIGQVLNYLKATRCPVGLILNFKRSTLEWKRVIL
jgi:GxxExxY protein